MPLPKPDGVALFLAFQAALAAAFLGLLVFAAGRWLGAW